MLEATERAGISIILIYFPNSKRTHIFYWAALPAFPWRLAPPPLLISQAEFSECLFNACSGHSTRQQQQILIKRKLRKKIKICRQNAQLSKVSACEWKDAKNRKLPQSYT